MSDEMNQRTQQKFYVEGVWFGFFSKPKISSGVWPKQTEYENYAQNRN